MNLLKRHIIMILTIILYNCNVSPEPINYGVDGCHFCRMTIVDKTHAAEVVTQKGKVYKFDASECMINFLKDFGTSQVKFFMSNDYTKPGELIDATHATFLISKNIPSPMGAFLSAFDNKEDALKMQSEKGGTLYNWQELLNHFK